MDINEAWKRTCRVLFGRDVGNMERYEAYLKAYVGPVRTVRRSCLSGAAITTGDDDFMGNARFISNEEREEYLLKNSAPFSINDIKDTDSLISAIGERFVYSGSILLGNCSNVKNAHRCTGVFEAHHSQDVSDCKYVAHCAMLRRSSFVFGSDCTGEIDFVIKNFQGWKSQRMLETTNTQYMSDAYYCANVRNCQEMMFCFNQRNKSHMIGNLALGKEKYLPLKAKLLSEFAEELERKKRLPSIAELLGAPARIASEVRPSSWDIDSKKPYFGRPKSYPASLDQAFSDTCNLLFEKPLPGKLTDYEGWLLRHVRAPPKAKSAAIGKPLLVLPILLNNPVRETHITEKEAEEMGKEALTEEAIGKISISNCIEALSPIAFATCEVALGNNMEVAETVSYSDSREVFGSSTMYDSKKCAYCCWVSHQAENMFGCDHVFYSKFCVNCYRSLRLQRCFEVNDSLDSSDCYFCHNIENCHDCMFSFNAKNLKYAIGNSEFPREEYLRIKGLLLSEIAAKAGAQKGLPFGIYGLGGIGR